MRVLLVHNFYQQAGGEDRVFADESELLLAHGHDVVTFTRHNNDVSRLNRLRILWDVDNAVRVMAHEVGADQ